MKISEVTEQQIMDYCGINEEEAAGLLPVMMQAARDFIIGFTGLTEEQIEEHSDLTEAYLILINDMYSQRDYTLSWQKQLNPAADAILHLYAHNYL